jgi:hypothetical protein
VAEVVGTHTSPKFGPGLVVVGEEIEIGGGILVIPQHNVLDCLGLEPCACISKFVRNDPNAIQIGIVVIDLVLGISPTVSDGHSRKPHSGELQEGTITEDLRSESGDVVAGEGFPCDVKRTLLEGRPLHVEVGEEVEEVVGGDAGRGDFRFVIGAVGEADVEGLVDEERVAEDVPGIGKFAGAVAGDADGAEFGEGSELGAAAGSALEPDEEGNSLVGFGDGVSCSSEEGVVHCGLALGVEPVYLFVSRVALVVQSR